MRDPPDAPTLEHFLSRQRGALEIRCQGCGHEDVWDSAFLAMRVGRQGMLASPAALIAKLRCAQCDGRALDAGALVDSNGFACMNYLTDEARRAAFSAWLDKLLGQGEGARRGVLHDGGAVAAKH